MPKPAEIIEFPQAKKPKKKPSTKVINGVEYITQHVRYTDPITQKKKSKYIYGKTAAEVKQKRAKFERLIAQGLRVSEQGMTVGQWAEHWLETYKKPKVGRKTFEGYENEVRLLNQAMGYKTLGSVIQADIVSHLNSRAGLSQSAINKTYNTVRAIFDAAVGSRLIPYNPCHNAELPKGTSGSHRALEPWEIRIIEKVAQTHRLGRGIMLMLWAGLRRGEACAFTHHGVHESELRVTQSAEYYENQAMLKDPKSEAGTRTTPIFPKLKPFLDFVGYAITTAGGKGPVSRSAFQKAFDSFLYACEEELNGCSKRWQPKSHVWKSFSFQTHDLRHTWFTMLYDTGVDVKVAASWGGHSDINVTMKIYQHIREERAKKEAKKAICSLSKNASGGKIGGKSKTYRLKPLSP